MQRPTFLPWEAKSAGMLSGSLPRLTWRAVGTPAAGPGRCRKQEAEGGCRVGVGGWVGVGMGLFPPRWAEL